MQISTFNTQSPQCEEFIRKISKDGLYDTTGIVVMAVCISGKADFVIDDDITTVGPDTGAFIADAKFRLVNVSPDWKATICVQSQEYMNGVYDGQTLYQFKKLMYRPRFFYMSSTKSRLCRFILFRMSYAANDPHSQFGEQIASCYNRIILYNALEINHRQSEKNGVHEKRENVISDQFISLVHEHHATTRKVKDYAEMMNLTPKYLAANVLAATGRHAVEWINDYAVQEIKKRLRDSEDSIQKIAMEMKFSTPSHLTKFFGDKVGITPLTYRKLRGGKSSESISD